MKILLIGSGAQGAIMASHLAKEAEVTEIICADRDLERAKRISASIKSKKVSIERVDATKPDDILGVTKGADVVVNLTPPYEPFSSNIMDAAFKSGAHYQDLNLPLTPTTPLPIYRWEILEQSDKWRDAGLTALVNTGATPGVSGVLAKNAAEYLDRVDEIRERLFADTISKEPLTIWWAEGSWTVPSWAPIVYENGEMKAYPHGGEEEYPFPYPIGPRKVFLSAHPEVESFPRFIGKGLRYVDVKFGPGIEMIRLLGLLSNKPIDVKGVKVAPLDVLLALTPPTPSLDEVESKIKAGIITDSYFCLVIEAKGEKAGVAVKHTSYLYVTLAQANKNVPGSTTIPYTVATPSAVLARMLGAGEIKTKGIIACEQLEAEARKAFLSKLAEKDIVTYESVERRY